MRRENNFDFVRLSAAFMVFIFHSVYLTKGLEYDWLYKITSGQMTSGILGVSVFFMVSGYLITGSWIRNPNWKIYLQSRILRIYPALILSVLLTVFVIGPAFTKSLDYWTNPGTIEYLKQLRLVNPPYELTGVFQDHRDNRPNGAVWTLWYEFACYICVLFLGLLKKLNKDIVTTASVAMVIILWNLPNSAWPIWEVMRYFFIGSALTLWEEEIPYRRDYALFSLLMIAASIPLAEFKIALAIFGTYLVIYTGRQKTFSALSRFGDFSYGLYIYGIPIQQSAISLGHGTPNDNFLFAFPITMIMAIFSWFVVERTALRYKKHYTTAL